MYTHILSSTIHNGRKRGSHPSPLTGEWMNRIRSIHTVEYYSALKRNESLTRATTWVNLEDIILSDTSQT